MVEQQPMLNIVSITFKLANKNIYTYTYTTPVESTTCKHSAISSTMTFTSSIPNLLIACPLSVTFAIWISTEVCPKTATA